MEIRPLKASEIECRAAQVKPNGVSLLLYKDARCDMRILDETFTPFGWKRSHELIGNKEFCTVSIKAESGEWISKQDCGTESNTEKEKGQSSDAFKRACFNWGIGRELYSAPFIWISSDKAEIEEKNGKYYLKSKFYVSDIQYENKEIVYLMIKNEKTAVAAYQWSKKEKQPETPDKMESFVCPVCGKKIKGGKLKGVMMSPEDIYDSFGMCVPCYQSQNQQTA